MTDHDDRRAGNEPAPRDQGAGTSEKAGGGEPHIGIDPARLQALIREIRDNQNLGLGIVGGLCAAMVGALVWAGITWKTGYQFGVMAIGIGFLVGFAVRLAGRGIDRSFAYAGAVLAFLGVVMGNLLAAAIAVADATGVSISHVLRLLDVSSSFQLLRITFRPMDLLFYGFAVYEGYKFSVRKLSREDLGRVTVTS